MKKVSIIVPCYNEEKTIRLLLDALWAQSYSRGEMEVIIADGMSTDGTRKVIAAFQQKFPDLKMRVVDNPKRNIPSGLNVALAAAEGEYVIRLDAHSIPDKEYVARSVNDLEAGLGDNVGGVWDIQPGGNGWAARSIAAAATSPVGTGNASYRYATKAGIVDTVPFGAFRRTYLNQIDGWDERLLSNEDYELNMRIKKMGGKVWLDPAIRCVYFTRTTFSALARQYWRYGYWKAQMLKRYPSTALWRQFLPPLLVASLFFFLALSIWLILARWVLLLEVFLYFMALLGIGMNSAIKKHDSALIIGVPGAVATMHLVWGAGLLYGLTANTLK
ncbi:MAG TPA: glycosyltransferase [Longilinea sp.]|nr:glycosyltransferase [Longilinea sp.]